MNIKQILDALNKRKEELEKALAKTIDDIKICEYEIINRKNNQSSIIFFKNDWCDYD